MLGVRGFPDRSYSGMKKYYSTLWDVAEADAEFALRLYKKEDWDLFFVYWSTIDAIGHFFWNSYDESDPFYKKDNPFRDVIPATYRLFDKILGKFLDLVGDDVTIILLSDHGHGARPLQCVNVNEILRQIDILNSKSVEQEPHLFIIEKIKKASIRFISRFGLAKIASKLMRNFPGVVQIFTRPATINWKKSSAYTTDMSGIKVYTYGGVVINRDKVSNQEDYETIRSLIISEIKARSVTGDGQPLLKFIARREDVYSGPFVNLFPDIVLEFIYGYGVGKGIDVPLITPVDSYNLVPGSHRGEFGTCIIKGPIPVNGECVDLLDIFPSVLGLYQVELSKERDGRNIFQTE